MKKILFQLTAISLFVIADITTIPVHENSVRKATLYLIANFINTIATLVLTLTLIYVADLAL